MESIQTVVEAGMTMQEFSALVKAHNFQEVYSTEFKLNTGESGTERIFVNAEKGMIIHSTSISGILDSARLLLEVKEGVNFQKVCADEYSFCKGEFNSVCHLSVRVKKAFGQQLLMISMVKCNSPWKIIPNSYFLFFVNPQEMQYDALDEGMTSLKKIEMSKDPLKRLFGIR